MTQTIDKLAWLHIENNRVLCVRSHGKETFYIPGGKRDPGENDQTALIREIQEELSVDLKPNTLSYFGTFSAQADGKPEGTLVQITCYKGQYSGELAIASEIAEMAWLNSADVNRCSVVVQHLFARLKQDGLID